MQTVPTEDSVRLRKFLGFIKTYTLFCPLLVIALIRGTTLPVGAAVQSASIGCIVALFTLLIAGISQLYTSQHKQAYSSFLYAGVALVWILLSLLLPSFRV